MDAHWQTLIQTKTKNAGMMKKNTDVAENKMIKYKSSVFFFVVFSVDVVFVVVTAVTVPFAENVELKKKKKKKLRFFFFFPVDDVCC